MALQDLRENYQQPPLRRADLAADPFDQFAAWFADAQAAGLHEPNAMTLATVSSNGRPAARTVLLKGIDGADARHRGFVFYTNYTSDKAADLAAHPHVALNFHWSPLARTVRISGPSEKTSFQETDAYFQSRPRGSQLGAWCSHQSRTIDNRGVLEDRQRELEARHPEGTPVPTPGFWGGYRVTPEAIEFCSCFPLVFFLREKVPSYEQYALGETWAIDIWI